MADWSDDDSGEDTISQHMRWNVRFGKKFNQKKKLPIQALPSDHFDANGRPYAVYQNMPLPPGMVRRKRR